MDWLTRWEQGKTGWHEAEGNAGLRKHWVQASSGNRVLVPLCGKSPDMLWLADRGCDVTGVELSEIAAKDFFVESGLRFEFVNVHGQSAFRSLEKPIRIICGDYFRFTDKAFDALYDRASLIALSAEVRPEYVQHTKSLLKPDANILLITLEYDQSKAGGPPFSVWPEEIEGYWPSLEKVMTCSDFENCPPKFKKAGISAFDEVVWRSQ